MRARPDLEVFLNTAITKNNENLALSLLQHFTPSASTTNGQPRLDSLDETNSSFLLLALQKNLYKLADALLDIYLQEKNPVMFTPNNEGITPAFYLACYGKIEAFKKLIDFAGNEHVWFSVANQGFSPLHCLFFPNVTEFLLHKLFECNAEAARLLNAKDANGMTPLVCLAGRQFLRKKPSAIAAALLIERGADMTIPDNQAWTALHRACHSLNVPLIRILLKTAQARQDKLEIVNAVNESGNTPLQEFYQSIKDAKTLPDDDVSPLLQDFLNAGAVIISNNKSQHVFHAALASKNIAIMQEMVAFLKNNEEAAALLNAPDDTNSTPFHLLVESIGNTEHQPFMQIVGECISLGADLCVRNQKKLTPLDYANPPLLTYLATRGYFINANLPTTMVPKLKSIMNSDQVLLLGMTIEKVSLAYKNPFTNNSFSLEEAIKHFKLCKAENEIKEGSTKLELGSMQKAILAHCRQVLKRQADAKIIRDFYMRCLSIHGSLQDLAAAHLEFNPAVSPRSYVDNRLYRMSEHYSAAAASASTSHQFPIPEQILELIPHYVKRLLDAASNEELEEIEKGFQFQMRAENREGLSRFIQTIQAQLDILNGYKTPKAITFYNSGGRALLPITLLIMYLTVLALLIYFTVKEPMHNTDVCSYDSDDNYSEGGWNCVCSNGDTYTDPSPDNKNCANAFHESYLRLRLAAITVGSTGFIPALLAMIFSCFKLGTEPTIKKQDYQDILTTLRYRVTDVLDQIAAREQAAKQIDASISYLPIPATKVAEIKRIQRELMHDNKRSELVDLFNRLLVELTALQQGLNKSTRVFDFFQSKETRINVRDISFSAMTVEDIIEPGDTADREPLIKGKEKVRRSYGS